MSEQRGARSGTEPGGRPPERALLDLLGLATRARGMVSGTDATRRGVREGAVHAVLVALDASPTQTRKLLPLAEARGVPFAACLTQEQMGAATGRGTVSALGLTHESFAKRALELAAAISPPQD